MVTTEHTGTPQDTQSPSGPGQDGVYLDAYGSDRSLHVDRVLYKAARVHPMDDAGLLISQKDKCFFHWGKKKAPNHVHMLTGEGN